MQWKVGIVLAALLALLCTACNGRYESEAKANSAAVAVTYKGESPAPPTPGDGQQQANTPPAATAPNPDWDRKIVKTADLAIKVKDFQQFTNRLHAAVKQSGGYIAQEQQTQDAGEIENTVSIRVPVDRFEDLIGELPGDSDKLEQKKITSDDVTMELVDTKSRLETKKEVRERYLDLLKQAHTMNDIITVQNEINDIQGQMDQAAGRIAWLGHSSAYSTINLKFYQLFDGIVPDNPTPGFAQRLKESIGEGWNSLSTLLLGLISVWPLWLLIGVVVVVVRRRLMRTKGPAVAAAAAMVAPPNEGA